MIFKGKQLNILSDDKVLEVGPGGSPHPRSDVFLEKNYDSKEQYLEQIGSANIGLKTNKPIYFYDGNQFPFEDNEFDYVICSHVIEHVSNIDYFISELTRVAKRGYLEFPTIYYDYLYDYPFHLNFLFYRDGVLNWVPKEKTNLKEWESVTDFFRSAVEKGHNHINSTLSNYIFQAFEWQSIVKLNRVEQINLVCYSSDEIQNISENKRHFNSTDFSKVKTVDFLSFKIKTFFRNLVSVANK